ncbi:response regulator transcription factor [Mucilaginibacter koreensis]
MIKIVLTEDHNVVRNGIRSLLEKSGFVQVIGEAVNGQEALALLNSGLIPDILFTDINMPGISGLDLITEIKATYPQVKVIVLSMLDNEKYVIKAFRSGASCYLLKSIRADEMIFAIQHIHANERYLCSELSLRFLDRLIHLPEISTLHEIGAHIDFSERELETLELIAQGLTNQDIAERLYTSKRTIEGYRKSMLEKTDMPNTAALIRFAIRNGIIN